MFVQLPHAPDGARLTVTDLVVIPLVDVDAWIRSRLGEGGFTSDAVESTTTTCGWPALVTRGVRDGVPTLRVFFRFLDLGAFAEATGDLTAAWAALREARPDYAGELATVIDLFT